MNCHQRLASVFRHVVRGKGAGQTRDQRSQQRPSAGWPHSPSRSHPALCCPTLGNSVPRRRLLPTLSVNAPLCPCCPPYASARRPPGVRGPPACRGSTGLGPGVPRHPGSGNGPWTRLHAPNPAPPGPENDGKPRATLGAPFSRAEREPRPSCPHTFSVRIQGPRQLMLGSRRAETRRPPRPRNGPLGDKGAIPGAARRRWTPRHRLGRGIAPLSGARPGLAERGRWGAGCRRHGPATGIYCGVGCRADGGRVRAGSASGVRRPASGEAPARCPGP